MFWPLPGLLQITTLSDMAEIRFSRPDLLDPALLRPGRLDKSLLCDMPSVDEREEVLISA